MKSRDAWLLLGLIGVALAAASCGYRFVAGEPLPGGIQRIFVPVAENRTAESGMEGVVTNALRREIIRRGLEVSPERAGAEAVLAVAVRFSTAGGTVDRTVTTSETYPVSAEPSATDRQRRLALETAADRLAQKVLNHLSADF